MIKLNEVIEHMNSLFRTKDLKSFSKEQGVTYDSKNPISKIGYCTNLSLDSIEKAYLSGVNLLVTHHDAWEFIYGLKEECITKLKEYGISHYFCHLPLDDADFGTNSSLLKKLGLNEVSKHGDEQGFQYGAVGVYNDPISFSELHAKIDALTGEPNMAWKFNDNLVKRVFVVCGAGFMTNEVKMAVDNDCDVYITGEKILYTVQYSKLKKINLIIGSHTFTEVFGVEGLVNKVLMKFKSIEGHLIIEEHLEMQPLINLSRDY